jgi:hypothetical protein
MTSGADQGYQVTLKTVALVTVPPGVVTLIVPVFAPAGTFVVIFVAASVVMLAAVPSKLTAVAPESLLPVMVTFFPGLPLAGLTLAMVGVGAVLPPIW